MRQNCMRKTLPLLLTLLAGLAIIFTLPGNSYAADGDGIQYQASGAPFVLEYQVDGYWWNNHTAFKYDIDFPAKGDKLYVTKNGVKTTYEFKYLKDNEEWYFVPEGGGTPIDYREDMTIEEPKNQVAWEAGQTYNIAVTYDGMSTSIPVQIIPNSVERIEYEPADPDRFVFYEYTQGWPEVKEDGTKVWNYNWIGLRN